MSDLGGEVRFDCQITDLLIRSRTDPMRVYDTALDRPMRDGRDQELRTDVVVLGSWPQCQRYLFHAKGTRQIPMQAKSFAVGVRMEHPQHDDQCKSVWSKTIRQFCLQQLTK